MQLKLNSYYKLNFHRRTNEGKYGNDSTKRKYWRSCWSFIGAGCGVCWKVIAMVCKQIECRRSAMSALYVYMYMQTQEMQYTFSWIEQDGYMAHKHLYVWQWKKHRKRKQTNIAGTKRKEEGNAT